MDKKKYIDSNGLICLYCGSEHIEHGEKILTLRPNPRQVVRCNKCGRSWVNVYQLFDVDLD